MEYQSVKAPMLNPDETYDLMVSAVDRKPCISMYGPVTYRIYLMFSSMGQDPVNKGA
jgi:hypothetical protein